MSFASRYELAFGQKLDTSSPWYTEDYQEGLSRLLDVDLKEIGSGMWDHLASIYDGDEDFGAVCLAAQKASTKKPNPVGYFYRIVEQFIVRNRRQREAK